MYSFKENLSGIWQLYIAENNACRSIASEISCENALKNQNFLNICGSVPGNFELDMLENGLIPDPFFGTNSLELQKLENRHLWYVKRFTYNGSNPENAYLLFEGIDTIADIYLNGEKIGSCDNMFLSHEFKATGILRGENELLVHIKPVCIEARKRKFNAEVNTQQPYNAASLTVRKAAHSFGWDIFLRAVSGGIWKDVFVVEKKPDYIRDIFIYTQNASSSRAVLGCFIDLELDGDFATDYSLKIEGICGNSRFLLHKKRLWHNQFTEYITVADPMLWWPRDIGEANLYSVKAELICGDKVLDTKEFNLGIRTVNLDRSDIADTQGNGKFCFFVNGERVFIRGTNWVPLDAFHSRDKERMPKALSLLKDSNCNMVRCWGGGVYEPHEFYDFCDKNGILVWQDFMMGCAAYPQTEEFCNQIKYEVERIVKQLRGHASLVLWAGDNECDIAVALWQEVARNPEDNKLTRVIIPEVLNRLDYTRKYLPSSPYLSPKAFELKGKNCLPEDHLWGPRDNFKGDYYTKSTALFASETGYHGCPSPESMKRFLSPEALWCPDSDEWQLHASCMETGENVAYCYRNRLMASQIKVLFGCEPENVERFALLSQLSQGEAVKFFIERFRSAKWNRTGIIWWNLIDGCPQFSDAVVDYYYNKKASYDFIKRSQEPVCLMVREPENGYLTLVAANEHLSDKNITFTVTDFTDGAVMAKGEAVLRANSITELEKLEFKGDKAHFYFLEWNCGGIIGKNHYLSGKAPFNPDEYIANLKKGDLLKTEGF